MSNSRFVLDGLWRCLCPSIDPAVASRLLRSPAPLLPRRVHATPRRAPVSRFGSRTRPCHVQQRQYSFTATATSPAPAPRRNSRANDDKGRNANPARTLAETPSPKELDKNVLRSASTEQITEALQVLRNRPDGFLVTAALVKHLVQERGELPNPRMYECLIASARDTKGSADMLAQLLAEMKTLKFPTGSRLCHEALQVLAVHPNYLLRNEILSAMQESWTEIDANGQCSIALGLLRDGQYELAASKFDDILDKYAADVPHWMIDIFILVFLQKGFLDEAVRMAHVKPHATAAEGIPLPLWHQLLDACSRASHYVGTSYAWNWLLEHDRRVLPDGLLLNVLHTAARHADPHLATQVTDLLSARGAKLALHHYEALVDAYAAHRDLDGALRVLCIMHDALSVVPDGSTRSLYLALRSQPALLPKALDALERLLLSEHRHVPLQAANAVLEGAVAGSGFDAALDMYLDWPRYTRARPDCVTLRHLLRACDDPETLRLLVSENPDAALRGDRASFERAVREFARVGDLESAYRCVDMLGATTPAPAPPAWLSRETGLVLVRRSLDARDERVWWLLEEAERRGLDLRTGLARLLAVWEQDREPPTFKSRRELTTGRRVLGGGGDVDADPVD
ncbi:hypothetical protein SODALDRAFT_307137 [Sodiomyces alkalinus F11]|uniref:Pentatricopeptide repeat-containing protein-mitochondrial domain-containing protein n=1 Tax=Sodiomyces alkalinus (strain CBS 110278 / VKM F-3762 / F11) TaxID=1314773 RepID=A0A3N2Q238_SODAK|nr:hypothetical protein SODALDRAFT_307137 [Sodiomyces alkalinus F11]ROT40738.1 hypothetical protein SODALDRAFT_307137 [Sodiomyces alkalinus F11]